VFKEMEFGLTLKPERKMSSPDVYLILIKMMIIFKISLLSDFAGRHLQHCNSSFYSIFNDSFVIRQ